MMRMLGRGGGYIPTSHGEATGSDDFIGNVLTSDPVRFARNTAVLEEAPELGLGAPTIAWADTAMRAMKLFADPAYAATIRQPILMVAAGRDEVVSTAAIGISASICSPAGISFSPAAGTVCRNRIIIAASSGRRLMPSYRARPVLGL